MSRRGWEAQPPDFFQPVPRLIFCLFGQAPAMPTPCYFWQTTLHVLQSYNIRSSLSVNLLCRLYYVGCWLAAWPPWLGQYVHTLYIFVDLRCSNSCNSTLWNLLTPVEQYHNKTTNTRTSGHVTDNTFRRKLFKCTLQAGKQQQPLMCDQLHTFRTMTSRLQSPTRKLCYSKDDRAMRAI